jgi:hypothetical protein
MRVVPVRGADVVDDAAIADVGRVFGQYRTLADLLGWAARQTPRVEVAEIVTQDEYTHDVVVPFGSVYLSFDTT